ncbi:alanine:cation symporter family protein [Kocuria rhizophila]|nr:alanine:cation symporter family protein [Kocuria rhizophila]
MSLGFGAAPARAARRDISSFAAMSTALAATVGTGKIVGAAAAIPSAGPARSSGRGSPRCSAWPPSTRSASWAAPPTRDTAGQLTGGPQVYLARGIPNKFGRFLSCHVAVCCAEGPMFGIGTITQGNAITASNLEHSFSVSPAATRLSWRGHGRQWWAASSRLPAVTTLTGAADDRAVHRLRAYIIAVNYQVSPRRWG